jgi:uncharacterized protein YndB with AHSA1/START domain
MFAHNDIVINAPRAVVWNYLVHAEQWPQWNSEAKRVHIRGRVSVLQKNTIFNWFSFDVPWHEDYYVVLRSQVVEYDPENRIAWSSHRNDSPWGTSTFYHTFLLTSLGPGKCSVVFEAVATGFSMMRVRMNMPEIMHFVHDVWLHALKRASESGP